MNKWIHLSMIGLTSSLLPVQQFLLLFSFFPNMNKSVGMLFQSMSTIYAFSSSYASLFSKAATTYEQIGFIFNWLARA